MIVGIDRALCGLEKHVVINGKASLCDVRPDDCDWIGVEQDHSDPRCLRTLMQLEGKSLNVTPPSAYSTMMKALNVQSSDPWAYVQPSRRLWWAADVIKTAREQLKTCDRRYHRDVFTPCTRLITKLQPWRVDPAVQESDDLNALSCVTSDGWLRPPTYNRFGTRTGRLTVTDGPRVLTVRQDTRALFRAVSDDHELVQFDFRSLEARVALGLAGRAVPLDSDPYVVIAQLMSIADRDVAKGATFTALYSDPTARTNRDPRVSQVRRIFKLGETFASLKQMLEKQGNIRNVYGRIIPDVLEETLYNNYVQSTGADVVLLGFNQLEEKLSALGAVPHFLLHDAFFASVPKSEVAAVVKLASEGVTVDGFNFSFPISTSTADGRPIV